MIPIQALLSLSKTADMRLFVQLSSQLTQLISAGTIPAGAHLPSSRQLASDLNIHRKTVIAAYNELQQQGWITMRPSVGTFVSEKLPISQPTLLQGIVSNDAKNSLNFIKRPHLIRHDPPKAPLMINEGTPDIRLAPVNDIRRIFRNQMARSYNLPLLGYNSPYGNEMLRQELVDYLKQTRGLTLKTENILITRGSQMGIYLASSLFLNPGDVVVTGELNYIATDITFQDRGAKLMTVPTDENGLQTEALEELCKKQHIALVYVTPHHHHPTTVTLSAQRRMHLLQLAETYDFVILEDDYDFDFHYRRSPILPLASADKTGRVVYIGAISKIVAPGLRVGYMTSSPEVIQEAANLRRIIDRQGDSVTEQIVAQMIKQGDIQRHSKKALRIYHERRDAFVERLNAIGVFNFASPEGGMAVWLGLDKNYPWEVVTKKLLEKGISIPPWQNYDRQHTGHNYIRLGFASLEEGERETFFMGLEEAFK